MSEPAGTTELLAPGPARALAALLDLPTDEIGDGWALPPLWHGVYFLDYPATADLGPEGHARHGILSPPAVGLRRVFGGGRVTTARPLWLGSEASSTLEVTATRQRAGRTGALTIVTTRRTIEQTGRVCVVDEQDIVYRPFGAGASTPAFETAPADSRTIDAAFLMRFSALTYNAHRIHYDVDYCREVEGYPNLVVHGPLQALLMAEHSRADRPFPHRFSYRLVAPLCLGQGLRLGPGLVTDDAGRVTARSEWVSAEPDG